MAIQQQARRDLVDAQATPDLRPGRVLRREVRSTPPQAQSRRRTSIQLPRFLHVPLQQMSVFFRTPMLRCKSAQTRRHHYLASEQVSVSLRSNTLQPVAPGASTDSGLSVGWSANGSTGVCQQAYRADAVYTPLFRLKSLGRRHWRRDGITPMIEK